MQNFTKTKDQLSPENINLKCQDSCEAMYELIFENGRFYYNRNMYVDYIPRLWRIKL